MASLASILVTLMTLLAAATASTPIELENPAATGRTLQAKKPACRTKAWAQCGGRGKPHGKRDGVWACCPAGFKCTKVNKWFWQCKSAKKKPAPKRKTAAKRKPAPKKKKPAPKRKPAPKKKPAKKLTANRRSSGAKFFSDNCSQIRQEMLQYSKWCKDYPLITGTVPRDGIYLGRHTLYKGALMQQVGYCGHKLEGWSDAASIAVSTCWLAKGKWQFGTDPYCGKCLCIKILGADPAINPSPPAALQQYIGKTFKGRVGDMCPECSCYSIDVLADRPYSKAWEGGDNPYAGTANARYKGPYVMDINTAITTGVFKVAWGWMPSCSSSCDASFF